MSNFNTLETSNYDGVPVALYEFTVQDQSWRFTTARVDITHNRRKYLSAAISDEGITLSGDPDDDDLTITMPSNDFTDLFLATPPSSEIYVTIRRLHYGESEAPVVWSGILTSVKRENSLVRKLTCRTITSTLNRLGLRLTFSRSCPHTLYDSSCRAPMEPFAQWVQVTRAFGTRFIHAGAVPSMPAYFDGGFVEFTTNGFLERRAIERQVGSTIWLLTTADGIEKDMWVRLFPGCNRTVETCHNKFNNLANYGGFPRLPSKSPFNTDPVY